MYKFFTYLSGSFIRIWLTTVFGFIILIGLLDSLANGADIVGGGGQFSDTFKYMAYRAPVIFDRVFIFTLVVAMLLLFVKLIRQHELVAFLSFGISTPKQITLLAPSVVGAALVSIMVINTAMPPSVRALQAWGIGEYKVKGVSPENPLWFEDNREIVRASLRFGLDRLGGVEIFTREIDGRVNSYIIADRATYDFDAEHWKLTGVQRLDISSADGRPINAQPVNEPLIWNSAQNPDSIARLAAEPRDLSLSDMRVFSEKGNSGSKPRFAYGFWYWHRITRPLAAFILLLCAVPIMQRLRRQDTGDKALILGIGIGFIFLIIDGALATFATTGGMTVLPAIASPLILFGLFGAYLCIETETR